MSIPRIDRQPDHTRCTVKDSIRSWLKSSSWAVRRYCLPSVRGLARAGCSRMMARNQRTMPRAPSHPSRSAVRLAPGMIALLEDEIKEGLKQRGIESRFAQFASLRGQDARQHGRPTQLVRAFGQLPAELVRQVVSQSAQGHGGGGTIHTEVAPGSLGQSFGTGASPGHGRREVGLEDTAEPSRRSKWHHRKKP